MSKKKAALLAIMVFTAVLGVLLLRAPSREQQAVADEQEALMQEILSEIHQNVYVPLMYWHEPLSGTDNDGCEIETLAAELPEDEYPETSYEPEYGEYEVFSPLPDYAFPSAIQGIGILSIERIDLRLPIAEGVEYATLRIAPGRVPQTAQVGAIGNAVIAGHRNYTFGSMFNRLGELETGDIVGFQARNGEEMAFEVFEIAVSEPHDQIAFIQPVNDSIITLYTCTPIRTATHRL
ncbi:MAG: class D sortase, partial [Defluviitaleaceae bacterium]|nr:class D sortase [Defluviitaleaceae bacterium]